MAVNERWKVAIPEGYRVYEKEFAISGVEHHKDNFMKMLKKGDVSFGMREDRDNKFDPNAIMVIGNRKFFFGNTEKQIGFVPAEIASRIADSKLFGQLMMRPKAFYAGDEGRCEFRVDLLGPKDLFEKY